MVGERTGRGATRILSRLITALVVSRFTSQKLRTFLARPSQQDLAVIRELMQAGKVRSVIDKCYSLSEVPASHSIFGRKTCSRKSGNKFWSLRTSANLQVLRNSGA